MSPSLVNAEDLIITPIKEGQPAPYSGVILDSPTAARIIVDKKLSEERCNIQKKSEIDRARADCEFKRSLLEAENQAQTQIIRLSL